MCRCEDIKKAIARMAFLLHDELLRLFRLGVSCVTKCEQWVKNETQKYECDSVAHVFAEGFCKADVDHDQDDEVDQRD